MTPAMISQAGRFDKIITCQLYERKWFKVIAKKPELFRDPDSIKQFLQYRADKMNTIITFKMITET
jgi:hypothetical protein